MPKNFFPLLPVLSVKIPKGQMTRYIKSRKKIQCLVISMEVAWLWTSQITTENFAEYKSAQSFWALRIKGSGLVSKWGGAKTCTQDWKPQKKLETLWSGEYSASREKAS